MNEKQKMSIYSRMPVFVQNLLCTMEGKRINVTRYGERYRRVEEDFNSRKGYTYEQLCEYRDKALAKMVRHCYDNVPYYRECFNDGGIDPDSIRCLDDMKKIPVLTKAQVNENFDKFFADGCDRSKLLRMHTSGSTGAGFIFYKTPESEDARWVDDWRYLNALGIERGTLRAYFGGRVVVPVDKDKPPFHRVDRSGNQVIFSSFHLKDKNMPYYIEALNKYRPKWLTGYPSSLVALAQYMTDHNIKLDYSVDYITISSENNTEEQRSLLKEVFGAYPYQYYSQVEGVSTFYERPDHRMFVVEDIAATELIEEEDGICRVIGSTLTNFDMPFLRYDTKDLVEYVETDEGRLITALNGRADDTLKLRGGGVVGRLSPIFKDMTAIYQTQVVQRDYDNIVVRVVKSARYTDDDEKALRKAIEERLPRELSYTIEYVDSIERTRGGKAKLVISEL